MKAKVFKKKKLILCCAAIVLIIAVALCLLFSCGNHKASEIAPPSDSLSISRTPPKDGSLPDQYEGIDNIAYIIGRLAEREYYHSETLGQVEASVLFITAGQTIYGSKDYKNGILLTSSVSISNNAFAPSKAIQRFYGDGKVVVRGAATPSSEWTGSDVEWSTGEPSEILDEAQYQERYGLWADEFSDYVINDETVLEVTPIEKTEDGNYTFTASLDGEQSTYYYKHQMVTMGDLDDYPVFSSVKLTFTFGADWTIYSLGIEEEYTSRKGVDASCKGSSVITYSYEEADADVSDYEEYFIRYADAAATGAGDKELTAADYLTYGFASFLTDEVALDADVSIGGSDLSAQILLDMRGLSFNSLKGRLGSLSFAYSENKIYLDYKDMQGYLNVSDILSLLGGSGGSQLDTDALMEDVMNSEIAKDGENVTLSCTLDLGSMQIPVRFGFTEREGEVSFGYIEADLEALGTDISVHAALAAEKPEISVPETAVDLYPYIESVKNLAEGRKYELGVSYKNEEIGLAVDGSVNVDAASGIAVSGDIAVTYGELSIPVGFTYVGDTVYLSAYNIKVSATSEEIASAVEAILAAANAEQPEISGIEIDAGKIVAAIIGLNFDEVIEELRLTGEGLYLTVDLDGLLSGLLGSETELGSLSAKYELATNTFTVQAMGAEVCFGGSEAMVAAPEDAADYVSLSRLTQFVKPVQEIINSNGAAFELSFDTKIEDVAMSAALAGEVRIADGGLDSLLLRVVLTIGGQEETVYIFYNSEGITLGYGGYNMRLSVGDLEKLQSSLQGLISGGAADEASRGVMLFMSEFDLGGFLHSLQLLSGSENAVTLIADLSDILGEGNEAFSVRAELLNGNKISLTAAKLSVLGLTAENLNVVASPVPEAYELDTSFLQWPNCDNVFEFVLAAYSKLFETEYLGLALSYADEGGISADVAGRVQFDTAVSEAKEVTVTLNLDFRAKVTADGQSHYLEAVILEDTLWASYSVKGFGADTALKVTLPISQLFVAGSTILPILAPILGISEDVYYYQFVDAILNGYAEMSEYYNTINSDIFGLPLYGEGTSAFDAWVDLILGIVGEYTGAPEAKTQEAEASAGSVSFTYGTSAAGNLYANILSGGMSVSLYALENAEPIGEDGYVLGGAQEAIAAPAGEYIDMSSIAQLLKDVLKAYDYANPSQGYHLSGTVTLDMNLALGSLPLATCSVPIDIDVRIGFDDAGTPSVYIKMQVAENSLKIAGFIPVKIVETDTVTELAIQNGNVYVARATSADGTNVNYANETVAYRFTGETEEGWLWKTVYNNYSTVTKKSYGDPVQYRAMTLASFLGGDIASIMEHMSFMLSLSSTVQSALDLALPDPNDDNTDSDNSASAVYDAGEMVKAYTFADNQYRLTLDMAAVAGDESFGDLNVNITRADDGELTALNGDLSILDFISIDFDFAHVDPGTHSEALAKCDEVEELVLSGGAQIPEEGYASGTVYRNAYVSYAEGTDKIKKSEDGRFADWLGYVLENGAWIQREWTIEDFISAVA